MDLVSGWNTLWSAFTGSNAQVNIILAAVGAGIIIVSLLGWIIGKRRAGGGGGMSGLPWFMLILGGIFASPTLLIPLLLGIVQIVLNLGVAVFGAFV